MMKSVFLAAAAALLVVSPALGDVYMHNPRGSNDRLNEANTNRNNGNRLFDSQNNAKGGYCYGPAMNYYEGSQLSIEWTNQHGCGSNPKLYCNLVIQYMCGRTSESSGLLQVRDGSDTGTISDDVAGNNPPEELDGNGDFRYGMHESFQFYEDCKVRDRNYGLWASDRNIVNADRPATNTRQNNNGNRRGLECPEERDYYPYWHPTPWRDVAILTHDMSWCSFYKRESQNVMAKGHCVTEAGTGAKANNPGSCAAPNTWVEEPAWGIPAPDCVLAPWSRHNHLGSGLNGFQNTYNWTLPTASEEECIKDSDCNCVLRLRYNISTSDLDEGTVDGDGKAKYLAGNQPEVILDWTKNGPNSPVTQDPFVKFDEKIELKLAIDTTQFGRTFQDRSHVFHILPRPSSVSGAARIYNLNVRGKRGNIVQTYPATEYDFVPQNLEVRVGDYIHFQWTGCDTNPAGNAGEGTDQTDRSNMVQMGEGEIAHMGRSYPATDDWMSANSGRLMFPSQEMRMRMAYLDQDPDSCLSYEQLLANNNNNENNADADPENCFKLNKASPYFDGGLVRMNRTGEFYYMSTRNNNFSNRGQKGSLFVVSPIPLWAIIILVLGGILALGACGMAAATMHARSNPHSPMAGLVQRLG